MTDTLKTSELVEGPYSVGLVRPELEEILYKGFGNAVFSNPIDGVRSGTDPVDFLLGKTIREGVETDLEVNNFSGKEYKLDFGSRKVIARKVEQTQKDGRKVFVLGIEMENPQLVLSRQIPIHQEVEIKWDPDNPNGYWRVLDSGKHTHDPEGKNSVEYQYIFTNTSNTRGQKSDYRVMFLTQEEYDNCVVPAKEMRKMGRTYPTNRNTYVTAAAPKKVQPPKGFRLFR